MTTFEIRFNELLALFRVTNKQLATALNVDPSLVSRWKNGQRYPSIKYNQMQDIAQFFLNLKQNDQEKQALQNIFAMQKLVTPHLSDPLQLLTQYLSERRAQTSASPTTTATTLPNLKQPRVIESPGQINKTYSIFHDNKGKRKAILRFLQQALKSLPTDIYIYSDENLIWWSEDVNFQKEWRDLLQEIVLKKHNVHIIHHPQQDHSSFFNYLNLWYQLHFSGNVRSYNSPQYLTLPIKESLMVLKDQLVVNARSTLLTPKENICFMYDHLPTVQMYESLFLGRLIHAQEMITAFKTQDQLQLLEAWLTASTTPYDVFKTTNHLPSLFLPKHVFEQYSSQLMHQHQLRYLNLQKQITSNQISMFNQIKYTLVLPITLFHNLQHQDDYTHFDPLFFGDSTLALTTQEIITTLKNLRFAIVRYAFFNVYILEESLIDDTLDLAFEQREFHVSFCTKNNQSATDVICLKTNDSNILHTFDYHHQQLIHQIAPVFKDKDYVISQIEKTIDLLESQLNKKESSRG